MDRNLKLRLILDAAGNARKFLQGVRGGSEQTSRALRQARERVSELQRTAKDVAAFRTIEGALGETRARIAAAKAEVMRLGAAMDAVDTPSKNMARGFEVAKQKLTELTRRQEVQNRALSEADARLEAAGVSTKALGAHQRRLERDLKTANGALAVQIDRMEVLGDRQRRMTAARGRLNQRQSFAADATGAGTSMLAAGAVLGAPLVVADRNAGELESRMTTIAQRSNMSAEATKRFERSMLATGRYANQTREEVTGVLDELTAQGFEMGAALKMTGSIGRAASAYQEDGRDISGAAGALRNLGLEANQTGAALDIMAVAGKRGNFEFGDMARAFPSLTAQAEGLGMKGTGAVADLAAALQIVRRGAGSAEEAATNLGNVMQKMGSPETERRFAKVGINLREELAKSAAAGVGPLEAIVELTRRATGGDASRLGYFFEDAQVQKGLRPLLSATEEYRQIRADALAAGGEVDRDFARRMQDNAERAKQMQIQADALAITFGQYLAPAFADIRSAASGLMENFNAWAQANPGLAKALAATVAVVAVVAVVFGAVVLAIGAVLGPLALAQFAFASFGIATGVALWPILAVIAAVTVLAAGAYLIYKNWGAISTWFGGVWNTIKAGAEACWQVLKTVFAFSPVGVMVQSFGKIWPFLQSLAPRFRTFGGQLILGLINGVLGGIPNLIRTIMNVGGRLISAFKTRLGIHSPSRVFARLGDYTMAGLTRGVDRSGDDALEAVRRVGSGMTAALALGAAAAPASAFDQGPRIGARPPSVESVRAPSIGSMTLNIYQLPGESADDLVQRVLKALNGGNNGHYGDDPEGFDG